MSAISPNPLALEGAAIARAQAVIEELRKNAEGLATLNHITAHLELEIRDACQALETISELRKALWSQQHKAFDEAKTFTEVARTL